MTPPKPGTPSEGKPADPEKTELEAEESKPAPQASGGQTPDEPKAKPKRRRRTPKAESTAAEATGVEEDVAAAATDEPSEPAAPTGPGDAVAAATDEPSESETAKGDDDDAGAAAEGEEPAAKPRRTRRKAAAAASPEPERRARRNGDAAPMVRAHAKYVRTSARKARLVCDHIRGKSVEEARAILAHANRDVARDWSKLLESAVANAEHNHELIGDELRIAAIKADEGPTLKRFRPRAMGRATKIRKRTSHLSITLTPKDGE